MKIKFMPQVEAERIIPTKNMAIISIVGQDSPPRRLKGWSNRLDLGFDDIVQETSGLHAPHKEDTNKIKGFIRTLPSNVDTIIVHCHMGQSRSSAVAKWLNEVYRTNDFPLFQSYNILVYRLLKS